MKKTLSLLLALVLCLGLFAGCASESATTPDAPVADEPATNEPADTPAEEPVEEPVDEPTEEPADAPAEQPTANVYPLCTDGSLELEMVVSLDRACVPKMNNLLTDGVNLAWPYLVEQTGVTVDMDCIPYDSYATQFGLIIASGMMPDIMQGSQYNGGLDQAYEDEVFIRLNEYEHLMPNYMSYVLSSEMNRKACYTDAGNLMGFGMAYTYPEPGTATYYIRQDWLDELNMEMPTTIPEWYDVLTAFKTNYTSDRGCLEIANCGPTYSGFFVGAFDASYGWGGDNPWILVDNQMVYSTVTDGFREYLETTAKWYEERLINPDFMSSMVQVSPEGSRMAQNIIGAAQMVFNMAGDFWAKVGVAPEGAYYSMCPFPTKDANSTRKLTNFAGGANVSSGGWLITTECEIPETAVQFMDYFYTEEAVFVANYGFENETFVYDENGNPVQMEIITTNPEGMSAMDAQSVYLIHGGLVLDCDRNFADVKEGTEAYKMWEYCATPGEYNFGGALSFSPEENSEIARINTDLTTYTNEMVMKWIVGELELNDDTWNEFVKNMESMDYLELVDMRQAAYERWLNK